MKISVPIEFYRAPLKMYPIIGATKFCKFQYAIVFFSTVDETLFFTAILIQVNFSSFIFSDLFQNSVKSSLQLELR